MHESPNFPNTACSVYEISVEENNIPSLIIIARVTSPPFTPGPSSLTYSFKEWPQVALELHLSTSI
jgi:hypothetical protein